MSRVLYLLVRGIGFAALLVCVAAVGLGRLAPRPASFLVFRPSRLEAINGYHFGPSQRGPRFFDPDTGRFTPIEFPGEDFIDCVTFADWEDEEGKSLVVGRWVHRGPTDGIGDGYGIGRYRVPGGETIDRIPLDIMPVGSPCFVPGKESEVVFAGGDGKLYYLDFESKHSRSLPGDRPVSRGKIEWKASGAKEPIFFNDPVWPTDPRLAGRLLVSVTVSRETGDGKPLRIGEVWWLQLNPERTAVVAAGRMIEHGLPAPRTSGIDEVQPNVAVTQEGGLAIAYLSRKVGKPGWELTVGPIDFDPASGAPTVRRVVQIAGTRAHASPIFSHDGRWVYSLPNSDPKPSGFERLALPESVLTPPSGRSDVAARMTSSAWN